MKQQKTTLAESIDINGRKKAYDAACKKVLAEKIILAWIMKYTMKEYADMTVEEIAGKYIIGEPSIADTPVLPDETNSPRIAGGSVSDTTITEGTVTYDICFRALVPSAKDVVTMIINVEAQNEFYPGYPLVKRGIYYGARMISSQYGTVFTKAHYEKVQKVYSIWICINPPKERNNSITEYSFVEKHLVGHVREKTDFYDLITVVMVCLGAKRDQSDNVLLGMLDVLLSWDLNAPEKKEILEREYGLPMTEELEGEVEQMCNLSDGVEQKGIEKGIKQGMLEALTALVKDRIISEEEAAKRMSITVEEFRIEQVKRMEIK